jgi:hypothetical protein
VSNQLSVKGAQHRQVAQHVIDVDLCEDDNWLVILCCHASQVQSPIKGRSAQPLCCCTEPLLWWLPHPSPARREPDAWTRSSGSVQPYAASLPVAPDPVLASLLYEEAVKQVSR